MLKPLPLFFLLLIVSLAGRSQFFPAENCKLHYVMIGFSFPAGKPADAYKLEIARGDQNSERSFKENIIKTIDCKENRVITDVPSFGQQYTWRVAYIAGNATAPGPLHHFSTLSIDDVNRDSLRMRIITGAEKYQDAYFFSDINRTLYDMTGRPVWFIPQTKKLHFEVRQVRDLKITARGTITFIVGGMEAYEINYNGDILWRAPKTRFQGYLNEDTTQRYNHELTLLGNGHYMVLNSEFAWSDPSQTPPKRGEVPPMPKPGEPVNHPVLFGTVLEYDHEGKIVWQWKSAAYFQRSDLLHYPNHVYTPMDDVHQNSFFFDEKNQFIYLSYKNIHRVIKMKYPEGNVVATYGEIYKEGQTEKGNPMFCYQHSVKVSQQGYLYLFNNNSCHQDHAPEIVMIKDPVSNNDTPTVLWKYEFPVTPLGELMSRLQRNPNQPLDKRGDETVGGNLVELPDRSMFASLCSPYGDLFIISPDKKVLWHAVNEKWNARENKWSQIHMYRGSIIPERKDLENLIWNSIPAN